MTPGLWTHEWRPICFTLVVDNSGVKYVGEEHAANLQAALRETYDIEVDKDGDKYVGISLDWDYANGKVHLSMPGYVSEALACFKHVCTKKHEDQPYCLFALNKICFASISLFGPLTGQARRYG